MICVVEDDPNIREIEVYAMKDCHCLLYTSCHGTNAGG